MPNKEINTLKSFKSIAVLCLVKRIFQTTPSFKRSSLCFLLEFCLSYPLPKSLLLCCCLYHKETSTAKYVYDKNYQLPPQALGVSQFFLPLSQYSFFLQEKQVADKVAEKRTDGQPLLAIAQCSSSI